MSIAAIGERIGAIQALIQELAAPRAAATTTAAAGATATATDFASALSALGLPTDTTGTAGGVTGEQIVAQATKYLGVPYVFGGEDETGMDCSGLVQRVLADLGIDAPRVVVDQADIGVEVPSLDQAQPGDLIVTRDEGHIVIYAGDGKIIHAPRPGKDVQLVDNYLSPAEIGTIRRVATAQPAAAAAAVPAAPSADLLPIVQTLFAGADRDGASLASLAAALAPVAAALEARAAAPTVPAAPAGTTAATAATVAATVAATGAAPAVAFAPTREGASDAAPQRRDDVVPVATLAAPAAGARAASAPAPAAAARSALAPQLSPPIVSLAQAGDGDHRLTLTVSPDDLGPVTVRAHISGDTMRIELLAPSDAGRDAIRHILGDLRRDLAAAAPHASLTLVGGDGSSTGQSATGQSGTGQSGTGQQAADGSAPRDAARGHGDGAPRAAIAREPGPTAAVPPSATSFDVLA